MGILDLFGFTKKKKKKIREMLNAGGIIVDIRSEMDFEAEHVINSVNIPYVQIDNKSDELKKLNKPIVLCCGTGDRSDLIASKLKKIGINCINGGSWKELL